MQQVDFSTSKIATPSSSPRQNCTLALDVTCGGMALLLRPRYSASPRLPPKLGRATSADFTYFRIPTQRGYSHLTTPRNDAQAQLWTIWPQPPLLDPWTAVAGGASSGGSWRHRRRFRMPNAPSC